MGQKPWRKLWRPALQRSPGRSHFSQNLFTPTAKYIPVLMGQAKIYWDRDNYPMVERIFRQSAEFCSEHEIWKLNVAHVFFMQETKFKEAVRYYDPFVKKAKGDFEWIPEDEEFYLIQEKEEKKDNQPDLIELTISNQEQKPALGDFVTEHQGFLDVMERKNLKESEIVPINVKEINGSIRAFVKSTYINVEYTRNIIWDSYTSFISPFDKFHHHNFIAQVKVKNVKRLKYLEVFYNPKSQKVTSDFVWIESDEEFFRKKESK